MNQAFLEYVREATGSVIQVEVKEPLDSVKFWWVGKFPKFDGFKPRGLCRYEGGRNV